MVALKRVLTRAGNPPVLGSRNAVVALKQNFIGKAKHRHLRSRNAVVALKPWCWRK